MCCVRYSLCTAISTSAPVDLSSWSLDLNMAAASNFNSLFLFSFIKIFFFIDVAKLESDIGTQCSEDYIEIGGVSDTCYSSSGAMTVTRLCGGRFNTDDAQVQDLSSVCGKK